MHTRKLQKLVTEMFKVKIGESPFIMYEIFQIDDSNNFNLRNNSELKSVNPKTVCYGTETIFVLGSHLWIILPTSIRTQQLLNNLKQRSRIGCL